MRNFHRSWWPSLPLRIGLVEAGPWADDLIRQSEPTVNWFSVPAGNQQSLCGSYALDAVVRCTPEGGLEMTTAVAVGREATLDDWAATLPISYSAVFPALLDTERVTLPEDWKHSPALAMSLFAAAATQSRSLHRLGLRDVAQGRRAFCPPTDPLTGREMYAGSADARATAMRALCAALTLAPEHEARGVRGIAARVASAYLATAHGLPEHERRACTEAAFRACPEDAAVALRCAAVRIGCGDDAGGLEAILQADELLRTAEFSHVPQTAFIEGELASANDAPMAIGRIAAGLCLLHATEPASILATLREDLEEEMAFSGLLVGRDPDRRLLLEVDAALAARHPAPARQAHEDTPTPTAAGQASAIVGTITTTVEPLPAGLGFTLVTPDTPLAESKPAAKSRKKPSRSKSAGQKRSAA